MSFLRYYDIITNLCVNGIVYVCVSRELSQFSVGKSSPKEFQGASNSEKKKQVGKVRKKFGCFHTRTALFCSETDDLFQISMYNSLGLLCVLIALL